MLRSALRSLAIVLVVVSALLPPALVAQQDEEPRLPEILTTGTASLTIDGAEHLIPMVETRLGPLFGLAPIVSRLGGELRSGPGGSMVLRLHDVEAILGPDAPAVTRGRTIVRLSQPARSGESGLMVPRDLLEQTLGQAMGYEFLWSPSDRRLYVSSRRQPEIEVGWDLVHIQGISTLVLTFPERPRYRIEEEGRRIVVELLAGEQASARTETRVDDPLLQDLEIRRNRILLTLRPGVVIEQYEQARPFRLVFDLYRRQEQVGVEEETEEEPAERDDLAVIVIDPGHGGSENGATGPSGVHEKELTLAIGRMLQRKLEARLPVRAILTRSEDADLPHDTRTSIANQNRADFFVSVHLNSSFGPTAHGAETYFLSLEASDPRAAAAAMEENRAGGEDPALDDLQLILWDLAQTRHLSESQRFATLVQDELNQTLGLRDRGVKQAPFRVLMGAAMPAVLVELGFLSNPEEESKLVTPSYQEDLVDALVRAITRYRARAETAETR